MSCLAYCLQIHTCSSLSRQLNKNSISNQTLINQDLAAFRSFKVPRKNNGYIKNQKNNITTDQQRALTALINLDLIIIKLADWQIVLQERTTYLIKANRQLENNNYYILFPQSMQPETQ